MYKYETQGTCSTSIEFEIQDGIIVKCRFDKGCGGNTVGLARMVEGQKAEDVIPRLRGIECRNGTSCPDQLAKALEEALAKEQGK